MRVLMPIVSTIFIVSRIGTEVTDRRRRQHKTGNIMEHTPVPPPRLKKSKSQIQLIMAEPPKTAAFIPPKQYNCLKAPDELELILKCYQFGPISAEEKTIVSSSETNYTDLLHQENLDNIKLLIQTDNNGNNKNRKHPSLRGHEDSEEIDSGVDFGDGFLSRNNSATRVQNDIDRNKIIEEHEESYIRKTISYGQNPPSKYFIANSSESRNKSKPQGTIEEEEHTIDIKELVKGEGLEMYADTHISHSGGLCDANQIFQERDDLLLSTPKMCMRDSELLPNTEKLIQNLFMNDRNLDIHASSSVNVLHESNNDLLIDNNKCSQMENTKNNINQSSLNMNNPDKSFQNVDETPNIGKLNHTLKDSKTSFATVQTCDITPNCFDALNVDCKGLASDQLQIKNDSISAFKSDCNQGLASDQLQIKRDSISAFKSDCNQSLKSDHKISQNFEVFLQNMLGSYESNSEDGAKKKSRPYTCEHFTIDNDLESSKGVCSFCEYDDSNKYVAYTQNNSHLNKEFSNQPNILSKCSFVDSILKSVTNSEQYNCENDKISDFILEHENNANNQISNSNQTLLPIKKNGVSDNVIRKHLNQYNTCSKTTLRDSNAYKNHSEISYSNNIEDSIRSENFTFQREMSSTEDDVRVILNPENKINEDFYTVESEIPDAVWKSDLASCEDIPCPIISEFPDLTLELPILAEMNFHDTILKETLKCDDISVQEDQPVDYSQCEYLILEDDPHILPGEYCVSLIKNWGSLGLQIEVNDNIYTIKLLHFHWFNCASLKII